MTNGRTYKSALLFLPYSTHVKRLLLALVLLASPAFAHDFWIEPSNYSPDRGEVVTFRLRVGQNFLGDALPRNPQLLTGFSVLSGSKPVIIDGDPGEEPAGSAAMPTSDVGVGIYTSRGSLATLDASTLAKYVAEEGLQPALRAAKISADKPLRDNFARCAKVLLRGERNTTGFDRVAGMALELIPVTNPYATKGTVTVKLLFEGKPLKDALIVAIPKRKPSAQNSARSDAKGMATMKLDRDGEWLIKAVHVVRSKTPGADVDSYWASLTFKRGIE